MSITVTGHALATAVLGLVSTVFLAIAALADLRELGWFALALAVFTVGVYLRGVVLTTVSEVVRNELAGQIAHARIYGVVPEPRQPGGRPRTPAH